MNGYRAITINEWLSRIEIRIVSCVDLYMFCNICMIERMNQYVNQCAIKHLKYLIIIKLLLSNKLILILIPMNDYRASKYVLFHVLIVYVL